MPVSIRTRLLLLMLAVLLPGIAAALWLIGQTFAAERESHERALRDSTRALSRLVDAELAQRAVIARVLASSHWLDRAPEPDTHEIAEFMQQAQRAMQGLGGWVELIGSEGQVLTTHEWQPGTARADRPAAAGPGLLDMPVVLPLQIDTQNGRPFAALVQPVQRRGQTQLNLRVTITPEELQHIIDAQKLPAGWTAAVMDNRGILVARFPGGTEYAGRTVTADLLALLAAKTEGLFQSVNLDGLPTTGYFSTSARGWTYVTGMPLSVYGGALPDAVLRVGLGALALLAVAVVAASAVARSIERPVRALTGAARQMQAGQPVALQATGIVECDDVGRALAEAAESIQHARADLESQVAAAVGRTREAEQRVSQTQRVEALGRLTGGVAHDFNNLLGVISNSAHLIQRFAERPEMEVPIAAILRTVELGSRLTRHLLRFAGRQPIRPQQQDLERWLPESRELLSTVLGQRVELAVSVAPGTWPVTVDANELELALINLSLNARDAMPDGGHLWIAARNASGEDSAGLKPGRYVLIAVNDDGKGMDPDVAERVFEPFFTTKDTGRGTGLGLSQVHGFSVQAGGTARLASTPGLGTTVSMLLPASPGSGRQDPLADASQPATPPAATIALARVLLVEDDPELGDVTAALLESHGARVQLVCNPQQALDVLRAGARFDVVLSDVAMPGEMDGVALAREVRRAWPALPAVLISGFSNALTQAGEFIVLRKPCTPEALLEALHEAMAEPATALRAHRLP